jgi:RNA polymerase sigma factor (sigma-70 family)
MTAKERKHLCDLLEKAIRGDELAIAGVCEFIDKHMKQEILNRLLRAGVGSYLEDAWQEVVLTVLRKLSQLKVVDAFKSWLRRVVKSVAKQFRPRYVRYGKPIQVIPQASEQPTGVGSRMIVIDGKPQAVRILEPLAPQEHLPRKRPLFEEITDGSLTKASISNRPNYPRKIDVWEAMSKLPPRWAEVLRLRHIEEYTAQETSEFLACSVMRVYRLTQLANRRMRGLLPGYPEGQPNAVRSVQTKQKNPKSNKHQPDRPRPVPFCGKFDATRPSCAEAFPA